MAYAIKLDGPRKLKLNDIDPKGDADFDKEERKEVLATLHAELSELQSLMYAASTNALLVVLQGRDTSGKDGTIRSVFSGLNPQSCRVESFKVPTEQEAAHDFLWRVHRVTPQRGSITIFNRSHYEDVLVTRVHKQVRKEVWRRRYDQINHFEQLLADSNTLIVKFYLHISKEEQEERLLAREEEVAKAWKLSVGDWQERELWDEYTAAYEDAISKCSRPDAPWYIVPANRKWYRNLAVAETLVETLRPFRQDWIRQLDEIGQEAKQKLAEMRSTQHESQTES